MAESMQENIVTSISTGAGPSYFQISCSNCRKSHRKCDRLLPNCLECTKRNLECCYNAPKQRSRKETSSSSTNLSTQESKTESKILDKLVGSCTTAQSTNFDATLLMYKNTTSPSSSFSSMTPNIATSLSNTTNLQQNIISHKRKLEETNTTEANLKKLHFTDPFASNNGSNHNIVVVTPEIAEALLKDSTQLQLCTTSLNAPLFRSQFPFQDIMHAFLDEMMKGFYYVTKDYIFNLLPSKEREETLLAKRHLFDFKVNRAIWYSFEALALLFVKNENRHVANLFYELAVRYVMDPDVYFEAENSFKLSCALVNLSHLSVLDPTKVKRAFTFNRSLRQFLSKQEEREAKGLLSEEEQKQLKAIYIALFKVDFVADIVDYTKYCETSVVTKMKAMVQGIQKSQELRYQNARAKELLPMIREYTQLSLQNLTLILNTLEQALSTFNQESFNTMQSMLAIFDEFISRLNIFANAMNKFSEGSQASFLVLLYTYRLDIILFFIQQFEHCRHEWDNNIQTELESKYLIAKQNAANEITKLLCSDVSWNKLRLHSYIQSFAMRSSQVHIDIAAQHQYYIEASQQRQSLVECLKGDLWILQECSSSNPAYEIRDNMINQLCTTINLLEFSPTTPSNSSYNPFTISPQFEIDQTNSPSSEWTSTSSLDQLHNPQEEDDDLLQQKILDLIEPLFQDTSTSSPNTTDEFDFLLIEPRQH